MGLTSPYPIHPPVGAEAVPLRRDAGGHHISGARGPVRGHGVRAHRVRAAHGAFPTADRARQPVHGAGGGHIRENLPSESWIMVVCECEGDGEMGMDATLNCWNTANC